MALNSEKPAPRLRILPMESGDGPGQMAADEALLETANGPTLRLYRWDPPAVSLGCFQDFDVIQASLPEERRGMAIVRRITGGGAIWHEHEVTYCLVGQAGADGLPEQPAQAYPLLHGAVLAALSAARAAVAPSGAGFALQTQTVGDRRYHAEPRCFASPARDDLLGPGGAKTLGSAARLRQGRLLMHGSLKLASNPWDREVVEGCGVDAEAAGKALVAGICAAFGFVPVAGDWTAEEVAARARIRAARYGTEDWVLRRVGPRP
jgi:lipoate-protein ligase A